MLLLSALAKCSVLLQRQNHIINYIYLVTKHQHFKNLYHIKVNEILGDISCGNQFSEDDNENVPTTTSGNTTIIYDPGQYVKSPLEEEKTISS